MKTLKDLTFRELYQQLIYIEEEKLLNIMKMGYQIPSLFDETGLLLYGYIDEDEGISFNALSLVKKDGDRFQFNDDPMKKKLKHKIKFDDVKDSKAETIELDPEDAMRYVDRAIEINNGLNTTESKSQLRLNIQLDQFRHQVHPDDLECFLYDLNRQASKAFWARGEKQTDTSILASVLTPLPKETGFAIGDMIELKLYKYKDSTRLIHVMSHEI